MNKDIVNKIKKVLALAAHDSGATEGERDNAMRQAYAMMRKYNVSQGELDKGDRGLHEYRGMNHAWCRICAVGLSNLFFCKYFYVRLAGGKIIHTFVGQEGNAITASSLLDYVTKSILKESKGSRSFCNGAADALRAKCVQMRMEAEKGPSIAAGTGLVLSSAYAQEQSLNEKHLESIKLKLRTGKDQRSISDSSAYFHGKDFGSKINLTKQVK